MVEKITETGGIVAVYNMRIADHHTYFVGTAEWGFSVWAHNECTAADVKEAIEKQAKKPLAHSEEVDAKLEEAKEHINKGDRAAAAKAAQEAAKLGGVDLDDNDARAAVDYAGDIMAEVPERVPDTTAHGGPPSTAGNGSPLDHNDEGPEEEDVTFCPGRRTLTQEEVEQTQGIVDRHGTVVPVRVAVVGSRAEKLGNNIETDLPVGHDARTERSDIDFKFDTTHPEADQIQEELNQVGVPAPGDLPIDRKYPGNARAGDHYDEDTIREPYIDFRTGQPPIHFGRD